MTKYVAIIAPHPDDETLGCGGTILKKISEGYQILLITITGGQNALSLIYGIHSNPAPKELKEIRLKETLNAIKELGIKPKNWFFLDYDDGKVEVYKSEITQHLLHLLNKFQPQEVYFPYYKDVNLDHKATSQIVQSCLSELNFSPSTYQYSIAQNFSRISPLLAKLLNPIVHTAIFVDVSKYLQKKREAIFQYKSQFSIISDKQPRPIMNDMNRFLNKNEMFYV